MVFINEWMASNTRTLPDPIYGADAIGGVVNVISNDIPTSVPTHVEGAIGSQTETVTPGAALSVGLVLAGAVAIGTAIGIPPVAAGLATLLDPLRRRARSSMWALQCLNVKD